jgi:hypothetical protein
VRSFWRQDNFDSYGSGPWESLSQSGRSFAIRSRGGHAIVHLGWPIEKVSDAERVRVASYLSGLRGGWDHIRYVAWDKPLAYSKCPAMVRALGFDWASHVNRTETSARYQVVTAQIPYWLPLAVFASLAAVAGRNWLIEARTKRRRAEGLCTGCGYDLRVTPGRCPECGRVQ